MFKLGKLYKIDTNNKIVKNLKASFIRVFKNPIAEFENEYNSYNEAFVKNLKLNDFFIPIVVLEQNKDVPTNIKILIPSENNTVGWINTWLVDYFIEVSE